MSNANNQLALQFNKQIQEKLDKICKPLFSLSGDKINSFSYHQFYADGTHLTLCNRLEFMELYLENAPFFPMTIKQAPPNSLKFLLWPANLKDTTLQALHEFNMWNGLTIYLRNDSYVEAWSFAAEPQHEDIKNFYLNNMDAIKFFLSNFNYLAKEFIEPGKNAQLALMYKKLDISFSQVGNHTDQNIKQVYKQELNPNKMMLRTTSGNIVFLSKREHQCLHFLAMGCSFKEIARKLSLSVRTVETYINTLKCKCGCDLKNMLIKMYYEHLKQYSIDINEVNV